MATRSDSLTRGGDDYLWNMFVEYVETVRSGARPIEMRFTQPVYRVFPALLGALNASGDGISVSLDSASPSLSRNCQFAGHTVSVLYECRPSSEGTTVIANVCPRVEQTADQMQILALVASAGDQINAELSVVRDRLEGHQ